MLKRAKDMATLVTITVLALARTALADNLTSNITAHDLGDRIIDAFVMAMMDIQMLQTLAVLIFFAIVLVVIYSFVGRRGRG